MEKFTNNRTEYWNAIKSELLNFSKSQENENLRFSYLEIGELLTHGFSIPNWRAFVKRAHLQRIRS